MAEKVDYREILKGVLAMIDATDDELVPSDPPGKKVKQFNELLDDIYGYVEKTLNTDQ